MSIRPSSIKVGPKVYQIIWAEAAIDKESVNRRQNMSGLTVHSDLIMYIRPNDADTVQKITLLHEILHCVWPTTWNHGDDFREGEENMICEIETGLLGVLVDNPVALEWMVSG